MSLPFLRNSDKKKPRLGRVSPIDVEVADTVGGWYYFGRVEMWEKEFELAPSPDDPEPAKPEKRNLFFYRLMTNWREDERIIVSDEDFIHNAEQIPYTQTTRGRNRMFQIIMVAFGMVYALTLYLTALFIQAGPSIIYYTQQVSNLEWDVGNVAFVFVAAAVIWAWAARYHHYVSDWEIQPLRINSVKVSTDFYLLTNSSKLPVFETTLRLAKLQKPAIDVMVSAMRQFEKEEIDRLQSQVESTQDQLSVTYAHGFANRQDAIEHSLATRTMRTRDKIDTTRMGILMAAIGIGGLIIGILASGVL